MSDFITVYSIIGIGSAVVFIFFLYQEYHSGSLDHLSYAHLWLFGIIFGCIWPISIVILGGHKVLMQLTTGSE